MQWFNFFPVFLPSKVNFTTIALCEFIQLKYTINWFWFLGKVYLMVSMVTETLGSTNISKLCNMIKVFQVCHN